MRRKISVSVEIKEKLAVAEMKDIQWRRYRVVQKDRDQHILLNLQ